MWLTGFDNHDTDDNLAERQELLRTATAESDKLPRLTPSGTTRSWPNGGCLPTISKRKGARSSIEALLKRASQGHEFTPIEPLVDVYNSISLRYGVPVGIEDRDKIAGDLHLGTAHRANPSSH